MAKIFLQELLLLLEFAKIHSDLLPTIKHATKIPFTIRKSGHDLQVVLDGAKPGEEAGDDTEIDKIISAVKKDLDGKFEIGYIYSSKSDATKPTGVVVLSGKNGHPITRISVIKKPTLRSKLDGNQKKEHQSRKSFSKTSKPGEANELHFVNLLRDKIGEAGGTATIEFKGYSTNNALKIDGVVGVEWVGSQNKKPDVEIFTEDGEVIRLSVKQRDFFEIDAGTTYREKELAKIYRELEKAIDSEKINVDQDGKFSKLSYHEIALKLTKEQAKQAFFGDDEVDAVIIESFLLKDFKLTSDKIVINVDYLIKTTADIHSRVWPYASINSDFEKSEHFSKPIYGKAFLSIVPRFRLKPHSRKDLNPKTLIIED